MRFGSLFAGIGGFDLALQRAGFGCAWQVEKNAQCNDVLAAHWPDVERHSDVEDFANMVERDATAAVRPDLICGGFPCQDLSVAGRRAGLAGKRSSLWFAFARILRAIAPVWVCVENVPGLLSSDKGRDMGTILRALGDLGYGFAYRVLDAQWFGVPQRRRRVFIVGCLGNGRRAAEVLFERESLPWDSPPRRAPRSRVAAALTRGADSGGRGGYAGRRCEDGVNLVGVGGGDIAHAVNGDGSKFGSGRQGQDTFVTHCLRPEGSDASEDGTGRGVPLVFDERSVTSRDNRAACRAGDPVPTLHEKPLAFATTFARNGRGAPDEVSPCLEHGGAGSRIDRRPTLLHRATVRRLTPRECERLQGFPDDWTLRGADGKQLSDSARYRMIGNAVAVPVAEWIARRINP